MRLKIESLSCGYDPSSPVLTGVDLELGSEDGLVCIIGPNGVGKSTLMRCIDNLLEPISGRVLLDGKDVREIGRRDLADMIGYVQTISSVRSPVSVFEAVSMGRYNRMGWRMTAKDLGMIEKAISVMDLEGLRDKRVDELSAGQFQKVMISRGLAQDTGILMLDEPTSNLDIRAQVFVSSLLGKIARKDGRLVLMICHDVNIASKMADKVLLLAKPGRVLAFGTPSEVINRGNIREAYGVDCDITEHEGRPNILIRSDSV